MDYMLRKALVAVGGGTGGVLPEADILVEDGRIGAVGAGLPAPRGPVEEMDLRGKMVIPGLINGHSHSYANLVKGMGDRLPLETWMYYAMLVGRYSPDEVRLAASLQVIECLRHGCTAFVDHLGREYAALEAALEAYSGTGIRAFLAPMISDKRYDEGLPFAGGELSAEERASFAGTAPRPPADILAEVEQLVRTWHGREGCLGVMVAPSGPQRCSDELLTAGMELAEKYDVGYHTHLLETRIQAETGRRLYGRPMVEHLAEIGVLSPRVSLAHAVWPGDHEIGLLARHGATVVHNPMSNLTLGSGIAPLLKYREAGVPVALGTDGSNCGGSQSIFQSMHLAAVLPRVATPDYTRWPSAAEVFRMATAGGARVLLAGDTLGALEPGRAADLVVLDLRRSAYQPLIDPLEQLVYGEEGGGVEMVMVNGRILLSGGRLLTIDEEAVLEEAARASSALAARRDEWIGATKKPYALVERLYRRHWSV